MLIFDVPEVKLFLLMIAEIVLYLIVFLCNRNLKICIFAYLKYLY
ncbi:hypothetical protein HSISS4_11584 [Streptococcus salivarius]|nr:hypothetical protein HSISS4_11584 [Streptococcus salivarius]